MSETKNKLKIEYSFDSHECETCGGMYSEGAVVEYDGKIILNTPANAGCFDCVNIEEGHILRALCDHLNIEIEGLDDIYDKIPESWLVK